MKRWHARVIRAVESKVEGVESNGPPLFFKAKAARLKQLTVFRRIKKQYISTIENYGTKLAIFGLILRLKENFKLYSE